MILIDIDKIYNKSIPYTLLQLTGALVKEGVKPFIELNGGLVEDKIGVFMSHLTQNA